MRALRFKPTRAAGLLTRLRRDRRGNVLAIVAAALIPLMAMVGAGIDVSRLYMARSRLQQACDAGALAGRRTMADPSTLTTADRQVAEKFFDYDYPAAAYAATNITRTYARGAYPGIVTGAAESTLPTTIMKIFGYGTVTLSVTCESTLIVPNTDIMFVLDVTGSMAETPAGDSQSKIASLKAAVKDFFVALGPGAASGPGRIRYGFMPYSSNVNVGKLVYAENHGWIAGGNGSENWHYQSRTPVVATKHDYSYGSESAKNNGTATDTAKTYPNNGAFTNDKTYTNYTLDQCQAKVTDVDTVASSTTTLTADEDPPAYPDNTRDRSYSTVEQHNYRDWAATYDASKKTCATKYRDGTYQRTIPSTTTTPVTWTDYQEFQSWTYENRTIDVAAFAGGGSGTNPAYWSGRYNGSTDPNVSNGETAPASFSWGGCIEEASTIDSITAASSLERPAAANDLNIDLVPSDTATRWKPFLPQLQYLRSNDNWYWRTAFRNAGYSACPAEARRLAMYTTDINATTKVSNSFSAYVDTLQPIGGTYHDIGLVWGARFLSPDGIFSASNANSAAPGQFAVDRHVVFMTDGELSTSNVLNDPWGVNYLDGRVAPTNSDNARMNETHLRRTSIVCEQMRAKGYTVWVIGFGITSMPTELQKCATDSDHWSVAANSAQLKARFQQIAQLIGGLRLTQ